MKDDLCEVGDRMEGNSYKDTFILSVDQRSTSEVHAAEQNEASEPTEGAHLLDIDSVHPNFHPKPDQLMSSRWALCSSW